jgi:hypothetical protein
LETNAAIRSDPTMDILLDSMKVVMMALLMVKQRVSKKVFEKVMMMGKKRDTQLELERVTMSALTMAILKVSKTVVTMALLLVRTSVWTKVMKREELMANQKVSM